MSSLCPSLFVSLSPCISVHPLLYRGVNTKQTPPDWRVLVRTGSIALNPRCNRAFSVKDRVDPHQTKAASPISNHKNVNNLPSCKWRSTDVNWTIKHRLPGSVCTLQSTVSSPASDKRQSSGTSFSFIHLCSPHSHRAWQCPLICGVWATGCTCTDRQWSGITSTTSLNDGMQRYDTSAQKGMNSQAVKINHEILIRALLSTASYWLQHAEGTKCKIKCWDCLRMISNDYWYLLTQWGPQHVFWYYRIMVVYKQRDSCEVTSTRLPGI